MLAASLVRPGSAHGGYLKGCTPLTRPSLPCASMLFFLYASGTLGIAPAFLARGMAFSDRIW